MAVTTSVSNTPNSSVVLVVHFQSFTTGMFCLVVLDVVWHWTPFVLKDFPLCVPIDQTVPTHRPAVGGAACVTVPLETHPLSHYSHTYLQGTPYDMCGSLKTPTADAPCEPGVTADDKEDGPAIYESVGSWVGSNL